MSTIPLSPTPAATATPYFPLLPLTPVSALPSSVSSATDVRMPTSLGFTSESSSPLRSVSVISLSYLSEPLFTQSEIKELEVGKEGEAEVLEAHCVGWCQSYSLLCHYRL